VRGNPRDPNARGSTLGGAGNGRFLAAAATSAPKNGRAIEAQGKQSVPGPSRSSRVGCPPWGPLGFGLFDLSAEFPSL